MKQNLSIIISILCLTACNFFDSKPKEKQDFYNTIAGWDIKHVPIIPPFRASSTGVGWLINGSTESLHLGKNIGGDIPVKSFGVSKNYIYGQNENNNWFFFNSSTLIYAEYSTENELNETLKIYKLEKKQILTCEKYFEQLSNNKRCYWFPKAGEDYPKFDDFQPENYYEIFVDGKQKITDFKLRETIKKTVSKIYYFKIKYDNNANDLFYISFDYSSPKLLKNDLTIAAYAVDNSSLNITIYTPFPVGQEKGIEEKNRLSISKQFDLK